MEYNKERKKEKKKKKEERQLDLVRISVRYNGI